MKLKTVWIFLAAYITFQVLLMHAALAQTIVCTLSQSQDGFDYEQVRAVKRIELKDGQSETLRDDSSRFAATVTSSDENRYTIALYAPGEKGLEVVGYSYASTSNPATLNNTQKQIGISCTKAL